MSAGLRRWSRRPDVREREGRAASLRTPARLGRQRRRLECTGERPSQRYLRRARLLDQVDLVTLRELVRELRAVR